MNVKNGVAFLFVAVVVVATAEVESGLVEKVLDQVQDEVESIKLSSMSIPGHDRFVNQERSQQMDKRNLILRLATERLSKVANVDLDEAESQILKSAHFRNIDICTVPVADCTQAEILSVFPPVGGRCNNVANPALGSVGRPFRRLLPLCNRNVTSVRDTLLTTVNSGEDDDSLENVNSLEDVDRKAFNCDSGNPLPNPRLVSRTFHTDSDVRIDRAQLFTMFGQFVCHDIFNTPTKPTAPALCCASAATKTDYVNCMPIIIPAGDAFFNAGDCLEFKRATVFCEERGGERLHLNTLTPYVDAGNVYGSDDATAAKIRATGGLLKVYDIGNLLPNISGKLTAGEGRAAENPALMTVHTIFLREHNRVAGLVAQANPALTETEVYNHAKRIVTAEFQNVVFGEFLPLLVGSRAVLPSSSGFTKYDPSVDPSIVNELSAAAFRFGHSLANGFFSQNDPMTGSPLGGYLLRTSNNNISIYLNNPDVGMTSIAKGMTLQAAQAHDRFVTQELTNFLYATAANNFAFGSDLAARNIQRGRDMGLNGWVFYRKLCKGEAPKSWKDRPEDISADNWKKLSTLYTSVKDIDLFTGSLAEDPVPNGILGRTPTCIIAEQFGRLMAGDRYFFSHGGDVGMRLTKQQIRAVRNVRMFDILCLNTNIKDLQRQAFKVPAASGNPLVPCSGAQSIDVSLFV